MQNQRQQIIREYQKRIDALEKPKMRITNDRQKTLHRWAVAADLADAVGGLIPVIGDAAMPFGTYELFKYKFRQYDVSTSEFLDAGGGGTTGKITTWIADFLVGLVPVLGDLLDLLFASWYFTIRSATKDIRKQDKKKITRYNQKVRRLQQELQRQLAQANVQSRKASVQEVQARNRQDRQPRNQAAPIPSDNIRGSTETIARKRYNKDTSS